MNLFRTNRFLMIWVLIVTLNHRENLIEFYFHSLFGFICLALTLIAIAGIVADAFEQDAERKYEQPVDDYIPPRNNRYYDDDNYSEQYKYHKNEKKQESYSPPSYVPFDSYAILGIPRIATEDEIRRAYLKEMKKHHPDRHRNDPESIRKQEEEKTKEINRAYEYLVK